MDCKRLVYMIFGESFLCPQCIVLSDRLLKVCISVLGQGATEELDRGISTLRGAFLPNAITIIRWFNPELNFQTLVIKQVNYDISMKLFY